MRSTICALVLMTTPAAADFQLDMTDQEVRKAVGAPVISDLAVGETARVSALEMCVDDRRLYVLSRTALDTGESGSAGGLTLLREPSNQASLKGEWNPPSLKQIMPIQQFLAARVAGAMMEPCPNNQPRLTVTTINGASSISELLKQGK